MTIIPRLVKGHQQGQSHLETEQQDFFSNKKLFFKKLRSGIANTDHKS